MCSLYVSMMDLTEPKPYSIKCYMLAFFFKEYVVVTVTCVRVYNFSLQKSEKS